MKWHIVLCMVASIVWNYLFKIRNKQDSNFMRECRKHVYKETEHDYSCKRIKLISQSQFISLQNGVIFNMDHIPHLLMSLCFHNSIPCNNLNRYLRVLLKHQSVKCQRIYTKKAEKKKLYHEMGRANCAEK